MPGRLIARSGPHAGAAYLLGPSETTLGRGEDNDVVIDSGHVSRHHARVRWDGERYVVEDLGSKNGTLLNGRRIEAPEPLKPGDAIEISGISLAFEVVEETLTYLAAPPPVPADAALRVDTVTAEVHARGEPVAVTAKEYLALAYLYGQAGALVTKEALADAVWPEYKGDVSDYNIEQLISRLRRKIEETPERPRHLLTVRGLGYRLVP
jgi:hypothetical protein